MKIIGMSVRSMAMRFCRSRPFMPGREISSSRQFGTRARGQSRNSWADANVFGCQPSFWIRSSSDSRTETSSSTTNTMGLAVAIDNPRFMSKRDGRHCTPLSRTCRGGSSFAPKCRVDGIEHSGVAERLVQKFHGSLPERLLPDVFVLLTGDKDDGNLLST